MIVIIRICHYHSEKFNFLSNLESKKKKKKKESPFHELSYSLENPTSNFNFNSNLFVRSIERESGRTLWKETRRIAGGSFNNYRNGDAERSLVNRVANGETSQRPVSGSNRDFYRSPFFSNFVQLMTF